VPYKVGDCHPLGLAAGHHRLQIYPKGSRLHEGFTFSKVNSGNTVSVGLHTVTNMVKIEYDNSNVTEFLRFRKFSFKKKPRGVPQGFVQTKNTGC